MENLSHFYSLASLKRLTLSLIVSVIFFAFKAIHAQGMSSTVGGLKASPTNSGTASVFWNPATIGPIRSTQIETNIALTGGWLIYDRSGTDPQSGREFDSATTSAMAPNPYFSIATPLGSKHVKFGYATYFPAGSWGKFNSEGAQRYDLIEGMFIPWTHQFTLAIQPNEEWSVAAAFIYSLGIFKADLDIDLGNVFAEVLDSDVSTAENPAVSSRIHIPTTIAHSFGGSVGTLYRPSIQWSFGASAFLPMKYNFNQKIDLERPSVFNSMNTTARALGFEEHNEIQSTVVFETPPIFAVGLRYQPYGYWSGDYFARYIASSLSRFVSVNFKSSSIETINGKSLRGAERKDSYLIGTSQSFSVSNKWLAGFHSSYHWNGVSDNMLATTRLDLNTLNLGVYSHYQWSKRLRLGGEYLHSFMFERNVVNTENDGFSDIGLSASPDTNGRYRAAADRLGVSLQYAF